MGFREQLRPEIAAKCDALRDKAQPLHPAWITHDICNDHVIGLNGESEHSDFWRHGAHCAVRAEVGQYLRKNFGPDRTADDPLQQTLPGFEYVQTHYIVERGGDDVAIPTQYLTDEEIDAVITRIRSTGASLFAHADDLERFKQSRTTPPLFRAAE